eukprot:scaffold29832_cov112-Isochrysis_galbana.AAC.7
MVRSGQFDSRVIGSAGYSILGSGVSGSGSGRPAAVSCAASASAWSLDPLRHIAEVERVVEAAHHVGAHLGNLEHLLELVRVAGDEVEKGELLHVLGALVGHLDHLVVAVLERLGAKPVPVLLVVQRLRRLQRNLDVAALDRQVEARLLVRHEVERNLRVALLLQVGDDGVARQLRLLDDPDHALKLLLVQRQLELALGHVDQHLAHLALAVQAVDGPARDARNVDGHVQRADDAVVPVDQAVLDVVERRVDKYLVAVPRARLDPDRLVHHAELLQPLVCDDDAVLGEERHVRVVRRPDHPCAAARRRGRRAPPTGAAASPCRRGTCSPSWHAGDLPVLVEHGEALARDEDCRCAGAPFAFLRLLRGPAVARERVELVRAAVAIEADEQHRLLLIEVDRAGDGRAARVARSPDRHERSVLARLVVVRAHVPVLDEEHAALHRREGWPLALQLEDDHAPVVSRGEEVRLLVDRQDPETVVLAAKRLHPLPLRHVPHTDGLVLRVGDDELLLWVEERARHIVDVSAQRVNLPSLGLVHAPQLDLPVVGARDNQRERRVERRPVDSPVVALQDILDRGVVAPEEILHLHVGDRLAQLAGQRTRGRQRVGRWLVEGVALLRRHRLRKRLLA